MRPAIRLLAALAGVAVLVAFLSRGAARSPEARPEPSTAPAAEGPIRARAPEPVVLPLRNPFRYEEAAAAPVSQPPPRRVVPHAADPAPVPTPSVRLTGFVERRGQRRAALAVPGGEVVLAGPGEQAAGYTVLAFEGDDGVRLRAPGGGEIQLRLER